MAVPEKKPYSLPILHQMLIKWEENPVDLNFFKETIEEDIEKVEVTDKFLKTYIECGCINKFPKLGELAELDLPFNHPKGRGFSWKTLINSSLCTPEKVIPEVKYVLDKYSQYSEFEYLLYNPDSKFNRIPALYITKGISDIFEQKRKEITVITYNISPLVEMDIFKENFNKCTDHLRNLFNIYKNVDLLSEFKINTMYFINFDYWKRIDYNFIYILPRNDIGHEVMRELLGFRNKFNEILSLSNSEEYKYYVKNCFFIFINDLV